MTYRVVNGLKSYYIEERDTGLEITRNESESYIRGICRKLNLGSGFNGWTPSFFTVEYPLD